MAIRRNSRSSPRARQRTYRQSLNPLLQKLSSQPAKNQLAKWAGLEPLEMRQLLSSVLQPLQPQVTATSVTDDHDASSSPTPAAYAGQVYLDDDGNTVVHPGSCNCPICMGLSAPASEEAFQQAISQISGGGATVAGGTTTGIGSSVTLGNETPSGNTPYGADYRANTEYMIGDVWVTVVLLNSNGQVDSKTESNWTSAQISTVKTEIIEGLNWWEETFRRQNPGSLSELNFFVDFTYTDSPVSTKYEPINRKFTENTLWVDDFLTATGSNTASSSITDMQKFNNAQRNANGTDWSFTVFIANSLNDTDGKFSDNYFAYSYFGGPFLTMTYDNGAWGANRMGQVLAHETGHIFYALDEYASGNSYTATSGYYGTQNTNAYTGNPNLASRQISIMAEAAMQEQAYVNYTSSTPSLQMLGWRDSNSNGVADVLDVPLTLTGSGSFNSSTGIYSFSGSSAVGKLANNNTYGPRLAVTTNTVDYLQYRINGGDWANANFYGTYAPSVSAAVVGVAGANTIQFRTIDANTGVTSNIISDSFTVSGSAAGVTVTPTSGLTTSESGTTAAFTVRLNSQPTSNVTISVASSNTAEGTVSTSSLVFTTSNWNTAQSVTVTGVNDSIVDGNKAYTVVLGAAVSNDSKYSALNPADVSLTNNDNDTAGFTVSPTSGLVTTEAGGTASFTVKLNSQPTSNVTVPVSSSNTAEGTVSVSSLTFTPSNWNTAQTVTVAGVNDTVADGNKAFTVVLAAVSSSDSSYNNLNPADVAVTNTDNDIAGFTVSPTSGLTTTEAGGTASFTVRLNSQPTSNVTVPVSSSNTAEGTVSVSSLTFTPSNWSTGQTITVTGVNDSAADGNKTYSVVLAAATSSDASYNSLNPTDVSVTNTDNDAAGFTVTPTTGLVTSEAGGTATFSVKLNSQPTSNVTIAITSSDATEGTAGVSSLTFTPANWNTAQTVTVTGVNENIADGDMAYSIVLAAAASSDASYNGLNPADVSLTNTDDDAAGFTVTPTTGLVTTEAGGTATFSVRLNSQPTSNVTVPVSSSNTAEGTVSVSSLTFTAANWNTAQTVTVTGVADAVADGNAAYSVVLGTATSSDSRYNGLNPADVALVNTNINIAGFTVTPTTGLTTTEAGGTASFSIKLKSQPTSNVTINLASTDATEGTASASSVTFTPSNWNTAQSVTVTGVNDDIDDDAAAYAVVFSSATSSDSSYDGLTPASVALVNSDDDTAGFTIAPTSGLNTSESGAAATFSVKLNSKPTSNVTLSVASSDTTEGTVSASSLTFTPDNWNVAQSVTVTGVNDSTTDGNTAYSVVLGAASSSDAKYSGLNPDDLTLVNADNDAAGVTVSPITGLTTTEAGGTAAFSVKLNAQPTSNVTISVASSNTAEGTVSVSSLTFTASNWNTAQTVTVTGVNDDIDDDNKNYSVLLGNISSADPSFNGLSVSSVSLTNIDNNVAGITVTPTSSLVTTEDGGIASFNIKLNSQPTSNVTIAIASSDTSEGTVSTSSLVFTPSNWDTAQSVTVTGVNENIVDGNQTYSILLSPAVSSDAKYNGMNPYDLAIVNADNDNAGITVTPTTGLITTEAGTKATFSVKLNTQPTANVVIPVASSNTAEGTVAVSSLTFTPSNWNTAQTVTVTGVNDLTEDTDKSYSIVLGSAVSSDAIYNGVNADDVTLTNVNTNFAGITVTPTDGLVTTEFGTSAVFGVVLDTRPTANVIITLTSDNADEGTPNLTSLTFTPDNWNVVQNVRVTGSDEGIADGNKAYRVILAPAISADSFYHLINPEDVSLVNEDNDPVGVRLTPTSGLVTTEAGGTASFSASLLSQPTADVFVDLASSNTNEGVINVTRLIFTPLNWNISQTVTATGVADDLIDGNISYSIQFSNTVSDDAIYDNLAVASVTLTNSDTTAPQTEGIEETEAEAPSVIVTPISQVTTEAGGTASFTLRLSAKPTASVYVRFNSSDRKVGTPNVTGVTFTPNNWDIEQTITITGKDNAVADGDRAYQILFSPIKSNDTAYMGQTINSISMVNTDNDVAGVVLSTPDTLSTSNKGGKAKYSIGLASEPTSDVVVDIESTDVATGKTNVTRYTFTSRNWKKGKAVTISGVKNKHADRNIAYRIVHSNLTSLDETYNGMDVADLNVVNVDLYAEERAADAAKAAAKAAKEAAKAAKGGKAAEPASAVAAAYTSVIDRIQSSDKINAVYLPEKATGSAVVNWLNNINKPIKMSAVHAA